MKNVYYIIFTFSIFNDLIFSSNPRRKPFRGNDISFGSQRWLRGPDLNRFAQRLCLCLHSCGARHFLGYRYAPSPLSTAAPTLSPFIRYRRRSKALLREPVGRRFKVYSKQEKSLRPKGTKRFFARCTDLDIFCDLYNLVGSADNRF